MPRRKRAHTNGTVIESNVQSSANIPATTTPTNADIRNQIRDLQYEMARERIAELEFAMEDVGWQEISAGGLTAWEFSRSALREICRKSRLMYLKNPIINRGVNVQAIYVWGQGVKITARDPDIQRIVERFLKDDGNKAELTAHRARVLKECDLQVDGNLFFALFTDPVNGSVSVRTIPCDEIEAIIHNPEDRKEPWFYKRKFTKTTLEAQTAAGIGTEHTIFYPDWNYLTPEKGPPLDHVSNGRYERDVRVFHMKVGGLSEMQFGVPETYQALDWARAYKSFLEDWATIVKSLSVFAWKAKGPANSNAFSKMQSVLGSTMGVNGVEGNPAAAAGSVFYESGDFDLMPMPKTGATIQADDGRRLLLMALSALGIPETFTGDVSVGTLATASSLDRPTELKFRDRQTMWSDTLSDVLQYVIRQAALSNQFGLTLQEIKDIDEREYIVLRRGQPVDTYVDINFPPILERDVEKIVRSVKTAATLDGAMTPDPEIIPRREVSRQMMRAIDVGDVDAQLNLLYPERDRTDG